MSGDVSIMGYGIMLTSQDISIGCVSWLVAVTRSFGWIIRVALDITRSFGWIFRLCSLRHKEFWLDRFKSKHARSKSER